MAFERTESYMHLCAKEVLASWLRSYGSNIESCLFNAGEDLIPAPCATNGVWLEYTFASSKFPQEIPFVSWEAFLYPKDESNSFPYEYVKNQVANYVKNQSAKSNITDSCNWSDCVVADIAIKPNRSLMFLTPSWGWLHKVPNIYHDCCFVFEVVHKHPVSQEKLDTYRRCGVLAVYEVSASWILSQTGVSNTIQCLNVYKLHEVTPLPDCNPVQSSVKESNPKYKFDGADLNLRALWAQVIANLEPLGTRAFMLQQGSLVFFDGEVARVAIYSRPLFKMAQGRIDNVEQAFFVVTGKKIVVSLEVLPEPKDSSAPPVIHTFVPPAIDVSVPPAIPALSAPPAIPVALLPYLGKDVPF